MAKKDAFQNKKGIGKYTTADAGLTRVSPPNYDSDNHNQKHDIYNRVMRNGERSDGFAAKLDNVDD